MGKVYYETRKEASIARRPWDRIYYDADIKKYYIVRIVKKPFWRL